MLEAINKIFNWKTNPASVFFIAIPLTGLAIGMLFMQAYLQYKLNNDIGYLVIFGVFSVLFAIAGIQMRRMWKLNIRPSKK